MNTVEAAAADRKLPAHGDHSSLKLNPSHLRELGRFGKRVNRQGFNFAVCDQAGQVAMLCEAGQFKSDSHQMAEVAARFNVWAANNESDAAGHGEMATVLDARYLAVALHDATAREEYRLAAIIDTGQGKGPGHRKENATLAMAAEMLGLFADKFKLLRENEEQIDLVSTELAQTYEELVLLHKISTNMEIVEPDANFLQMACDSLTGIVDVEGIAILQERTIDDEKRFMLVAGSGLIEIDEQMTVDVYDRLVKEMRSGKEALLDSEVDAPFKYEWPENIRNIIVVPLCGKEKTGNTERTNAASNMRGNESRIIALMVAVNRVDKRDFDSTVVKLFTSVASECAVFVENNRLFNDLKELFIGSLKALTRSIDAKDRYTRGHSERVAFISKWIAERMAEQNLLDAEQVPRIYLAGLLHDVGKIGIDEAVLCKKGKLTRTELSRLRMHPSIAGSILSGIKQMREIIPGIVCHHEWVDGNGYPNGMKADDIPLMGKIVGLADSFDAMTSERVYRDARTVEETLDEIQGRIGVQFDPAVARVFLESDVYRLWDLMREGVTTAYGADDFSRYGAEAVGSLIR